MAKKPAAPPDPTAKPRRGRPPKPGGRIPQVEVQRAYRARLAAAGKVVRIVDARAVSDRDTIAEMRDKLHNASLKLELREEEVARLRDRNAYLESELKAQERYLTNALKDNLVLKQRLAQKPNGRARAARPADGDRNAAAGDA